MAGQDLELIRARKIVVWVARAITYLIYFFVIVAEIILVIGFFLLLFGANPTAGFTQWAYRNLDRVMAPFRGIFAPIELGTTSADVDAVFDTSVLFAMIVYGILALLMSWLIHWLTDRLLRLDSLEADIERRQYEQAQREAIAARAAQSQPTYGAVTTSTTYPTGTPGTVPPGTIPSQGNPQPVYPPDSNPPYPPQ